MESKAQSGKMDRMRYSTIVPNSRGNIFEVETAFILKDLFVVKFSGIHERTKHL